MKRPIKILHISDLHFRHNGRLYYSTTKKINNGFILNNFSVLHISDRDIQKEKKNLFDIGSRKYLNYKIIENIKNFRPDIIFFGHVDRLNYLDLLTIKEKFKDIKIAQWFIDPLVKKGPDYEKNKERFHLKYQFADANFITTSPSKLSFADKNCYFIPNAVDPSIDVYKNYLKINEYDVFLAISHGVHRGVLKKNHFDDRVDFIKKITTKTKNNFFGYEKNPVWGAKYFDEISKCNMGINITRGNPIKYYSSERMATLLGNGILTFEHEDYHYQDFFKNDEMIFFKNSIDLNSKILFYKKNDHLRKKIAKNGYIKAHKIFNNKIIAKYMVDRTLGEKITNPQVWHNG